MLKRKASLKKMFSPIISGTIIQAVVIRLTQISKQAEETTVVIHLRLRHGVSSQTYSLNANLCHLRLYQVHRDDFMLNVKLWLFVLIAKQPAFHQLRSVEQLGYITALLQRNDCGIRGVEDCSLLYNPQ